MSKAKRLVGIVFAVLFAVSAFGCMAQSPTPLQAAGHTQQSGTALQSGGTALAAENADDDKLSAYLFVYFVGPATPTDPDDEEIRFSVSQDGYTWETLNDGKPIMESTLGEHGVRDPHIIRKQDNTFCIIATDLSIAEGHKEEYGTNRAPGWGGCQKDGSRALIVWDSDDLVEWKNIRRCEVGTENSSNVWAPESIWDKEKQQYMVFWSSKTDEEWKYRLYRCYTSDYVTFSEPEVYIEFDDPYIDATFIQDGEWYYRFTKNEDTKHIIMEKSKSLSGPFLAVDTYTVNGKPGIEETGRVGYEGPTGYKINGEDRWMLLLDGLNTNQGYKPFVTDDLDAGTFVSAQAFDFGGADFRHGSCIPITGKEYKALLKEYNKEPDRREGDLVFSLDFEDNLTAGGTKGGATANGTITYEQGYKNKAAKINGTNYIDITGEENNPIAGLDEMTISFALKVDGKSWPFFATSSDDAEPSWPNEKYLGVIWGDNGSSNLTVQRWWNEGGRGPTTDMKGFTSGEWHHVTISFYEGNTVLYVDGQRKGTCAATQDTKLTHILGNAPKVRIGRANWDGGQYSNMLIDSFKIYNYAMNREQAAAHYNAEKA